MIKSLLERFIYQLNKKKDKKYRIPPSERNGDRSTKSYKGIKLIYELLFFPDPDQNFASVKELLENGFKILFED